MAPSLRTPPTAWALGAWAIYGALALLVGGGLPFVRFPAFTFPRAEGETAVPFFLADGVPADIEDYTAFVGVDPEKVDLRHHGVACSVEHRLHEQQAWLRAHAAPPGSAPGPTRVEIGLRILGVEGGAFRERLRVDAAGTARPAP